MTKKPRKTFADIVKEAESLPKIEEKIDASKGNGFISPEGIEFRNGESIDEHRAEQLYSEGARVVLDDCGSYGYAGALEWPEVTDVRRNRMPVIKANRRHWYSLELWTSNAGDCVLYLGGNAFRWDNNG